MPEMRGRHEYNGACLGAVEFESTGHRGGDAGHGGFVKVTFLDRGGMGLDVQTDKVMHRDVSEVSLTFSGDSEIDAAIEFFEFLAAKLRSTIS